MSQLVGNRTIEFANSPGIIGYAAVGSNYEKDGRFGELFDFIFDDPMASKDSWEQAESEFQKRALGYALKKAKLSEKDIQVLFAGDLLNQCVGSTFGTMQYSIPFCGVYGACSTMALSLIMASVFADNGIGQNCAAVTSSHFCSAERQYRFPLEYGSQRAPTTQWTATASGAVIVSNKGSNVRVKKATIGTVVDLGVTDQNNMGAAMAPDDVKIRPYPTNEGMVFFYTQIYIKGGLSYYISFQILPVRPSHNLMFNPRHAPLQGGGLVMW